MLELSTESRTLAGILLLALVTVESGGYLMTKVLRRKVPTSELQEKFFRAGHAHAGVWLTVALIVVVLVDATELTGFVAWIARVGVPFGAILLPAGFFLSAAGSGVTRPNKLFVLVWLGALSFTIGVSTAGIGLLVA